MSLAVGWRRFLTPSGILLLASPHSLLQPLSVSAKLVPWPPPAPLGVSFPTALVCGSVCPLGLSPAAASGLLSLPPVDLHSLQCCCWSWYLHLDGSLNSCLSEGDQKHGTFGRHPKPRE